MQRRLEYPEMVDCAGNWYAIKQYGAGRENVGKTGKIKRTANNCSQSFGSLIKLWKARVLPCHVPPRVLHR